MSCCFSSRSSQDKNNHKGKREVDDDEEEDKLDLVNKCLREVVFLYKISSIIEIVLYLMLFTLFNYFYYFYFNHVGLSNRGLWERNELVKRIALENVYNSTDLYTMLINDDLSKSNEKFLLEFFHSLLQNSPMLAKNHSEFRLYKNQIELNYMIRKDVNSSAFMKQCLKENLISGLFTKCSSSQGQNEFRVEKVREKIDLIEYFKHEPKKSRSNLLFRASSRLTSYFQIKFLTLSNQRDNDSIMTSFKLNFKLNNQNRLILLVLDSLFTFKYVQYEKSFLYFVLFSMLFYFIYYAYEKIFEMKNSFVNSNNNSSNDDNHTLLISEENFLIYIFDMFLFYFLLMSIFYLMKLIEFNTRRYSKSAASIDLSAYADNYELFLTNYSIFSILLVPNLFLKYSIIYR
jgi:hypothetical protein